MDSSKLMNDDELLYLANLFVEDFGIRKIRVTGGEPLVRKNAGQLIRHLSNLPVELTMTTNGILLGRYFDDIIGSGMRSINISLDSLKNEKLKTVAGSGQLAIIRQNIDKCIESGIHVKVNMVVLRSVNFEEITDFIEWTKEKDIHVRFIEFMPFNGNSWEWDKTVSFKEMMEKIDTRFSYSKLDDTPQSTAKSFRVEGYKGTFAVISSVTSPFCEGCNRIRLTADGKLKNCLFAQNETDLLTALRNGENVHELVLSSVQQKKIERGGLPDFKEPVASESYDRNRMMTAIGG